MYNFKGLTHNIVILKVELDNILERLTYNDFFLNSGYDSDFFHHAILSARIYSGISKLLFIKNFKPSIQLKKCRLEMIDSHDRSIIYPNPTDRNDRQCVFVIHLR